MGNIGEIHLETCVCCGAEIDGSEALEFGCERCCDAAIANLELALMFDSITDSDVDAFAKEEQSWIAANAR